MAPGRTDNVPTGRSRAEGRPSKALNFREGAYESKRLFSSRLMRISKCASIHAGWRGVICYFRIRARSPVRRAAAPVPAASSAPAAVPARSATGSAHVAQWAEEMRTFLEPRRDDYLLLETIELDVMSEGEGEALRACVEAEMARCRQVGAAFEALPADAAQAIGVLRQAAIVKQPAPLDAFFGLRFDDDCDSTRNGATAHPLGLTGWSEVLYFELLDRAGFEARQSEH